ncbi:hypothetical protein GGX14DRAFT_401402 [Mycena pura]|uniref:Uncharacterized protein n=1 Tax=Mycena pura TaxID=153505 RepID=A0AAD6V4A0_9AGAR|nr:hypothetical protein GGX14DRAFT_401402 [Mycena pura]
MAHFERTAKMRAAKQNGRTKVFMLLWPGTVEFLVENETTEFFFHEMSTRIPIRQFFHTSDSQLPKGDFRQIHRHDCDAIFKRFVCEDFSPGDMGKDLRVWGTAAVPRGANVERKRLLYHFVQFVFEEIFEYAKQVTGKNGPKDTIFFATTV